MDLYADLPLAKGASTALGGDADAKTSTAWAKGVPAFVPAAVGAQRSAPSVSTSMGMLPASLAGSRNKSPSAAAPAGRGRGISLAFRPPSVTRKATGVATASARASMFDRANHKVDAPIAAPVEDAAPRGGLGFVAATTWTQVTVQKETTETQEDDAAAAAGDGANANTHFFQATYRDEYHPSRPNNYEAFCEERAAKTKMEQVRRDLERRQREQDLEASGCSISPAPGHSRLTPLVGFALQSKREREQLVRDVNEGKAPSIALPTTVGRGRGMTVPAWMRKKIEESASKPTTVPTIDAVTAGASPDQFEDAPPRVGLGFAAPSLQLDTAADHALGDTHSVRSPRRDEFGRDVSARGDTRRHRDEEDASPPRSERHEPSHGKNRSRSRDQVSDRAHRHRSEEVREFKPRPSRVILLQNMVGPGEVDEELQDEVKEECSSKYGPVTKCVVFERKGRVDPEKAVRIFVDFHDQVHADQALNGLNSRFFGGRRVKATYYDESKFMRLDLDA